MMQQGARNIVRRFSRLAEAMETTAAPRIPAFDHVPLPYDGPSAAEIARKRAEFLSPSLFHFYSKPLNIVEGKMQYLYDEDGRRYLDAFGGIATVCCGHCHPDVVDAITAQASRLQHSTVLYLNHAIADFAEALANKLPGDLKVVFFTNSGMEANELAILMARLYTGSHDIISLRNSYHGNAAGTMGATAQKNWKFNVVQSGVHHAVNPDPYRGAFGADAEKYVRDVQEIIEFGTTGQVAGFISEAIQGVGGIVELSPGYLPLAYERRRGLHRLHPAVLKDHLRGLQEKHEIIGDVRGTGFMLGVELVTDRQLKTPAKDEICHAMEHTKEMGILVGKGGFYGTVFRITPASARKMPISSSK